MTERPLQSTIVLGVVLTCALFACGGKTDLLLGEETAAPDTGVPDSTLPDTSVPDTFVPDTRVPDTSSPDTLVPDTAPPDTFVPCSALEPSAGTRCATEGQTCSWNSACGGVDRGTCAGAAWSISVGPCPPPTAGCPATAPTAGSPCPSSSEICDYGNACGAVVAAQCTPGGWVITEFPCKPECPFAAPPIGSACEALRPRETCDYTFGPTCSFACLCYLSRWTCYGTPCTDPPTGSGLDGGV